MREIKGREGDIITKNNNPLHHITSSSVSKFQQNVYMFEKNMEHHTGADQPAF